MKQSEAILRAMPVPVGMCVNVCVQEWLRGPLQSEGIFLQGTDSSGRALAIIRVADHVSDKKLLKTMKLFVCYVMNAMVRPRVKGQSCRAEKASALSIRSAETTVPEWLAGQCGLVRLGQQRVVVKFSGRSGTDSVFSRQTHAVPDSIPAGCRCVREV